MPRRASAPRSSAQQDGAAAVEFGLVAVPFLALTFAIMETAMVFFAGQTLEAAAADSGAPDHDRPGADRGISAQTAFKNAVCNQIFGLFDCANGVYVDVKSYTRFAAISMTPPVDQRPAQHHQHGYTPGGPGDIVVVSLYYQWPIYVSLLGNNLANMNGSKRLLVATAVFRNEPYQ